MIKYRPYSHTYEESIKEEKLFMTKDDLFEYIVEEYNSIRPIESPAITKEDLLISEPICINKILKDTLQWKETRYVLTKNSVIVNIQLPKRLDIAVSKRMIKKLL